MARTHPRHRVDGIERAAALHAEAVALADTAAQVLEQCAPQDAPAPQYAQQRELATRLRAAATELVPGWLGASLIAYPPTGPLPAPGSGAGVPRYVRVGTAHPLEDAAFPAVVPLLGGGGNLAIDADARDARTAGLLRSLVLRLVAATPAGALRVRVVDPTGAVFAPFSALGSLGIVWSAPGDPGDGLRAAIADAEEWVRRPGRYTMLVVIAGLPELTEGGDLTRLTELARLGPGNRLHLVVAGWPPPPLTEQAAQDALPLATQVVVRNPHALVGDPPGTGFGSGGALN
ncbi:MAG: cell division protein FtsK, partial [Micromonosporaceae bacterium]|nr:cell division protein FtsK [Micromonosporaceae bacterium]